SVSDTVKSDGVAFVDAGMSRRVGVSSIHAEYYLPFILTHSGSTQQLKVSRPAAAVGYSAACVVYDSDSLVYSGFTTADSVFSIPLPVGYSYAKVSVGLQMQTATFAD